MVDVKEELKRTAVPSHAKWAEANGMSQQYVSDVIAGKKPPGPKILDALGLERVITYRPKPKGDEE